MAHAQKRISNPVTGQDILFLQTAADTGGALLEMESTYHARSVEPVTHYHPEQEEDFTVVQGEIHVRLHGEVRVLRSGDQLHIPRNTIHSMWNASDGVSVVNWQVRPALRTEHLLETGMGLAEDGRVNAKGMPTLLQIAVMMFTFSREYRLAKPPYLIQVLIFGLLYPIARLAGYRGYYDRYIQ